MTELEQINQSDSLSSRAINWLTQNGSRKTLFPILGVGIIVCDILVGFYISSTAIGWNDTLVILFGFILLTYHLFPSHFSFERDFLLFFILLSNLLLVVPAALPQILSGEIGSVKPGLPFFDAMFTPLFLVKPLSSMLTLFGIENFPEGNIIKIRDINNDILSVSIAYSCTGFQSVGIFLSAYISYILNRTKEINANLVLFLFVGVLVSYFANLFRMFLIMLTGYFWGGSILYYTHQNIGWLIFLIWISIFWYFLDRYLPKED